jgi:hypothetical protein
MRTPISRGNRSTHLAALIAALLTALVAARAGAEEQEPKKGPPKAPADYQIVESDLAGSYFVARPLKEKYDNLVKRVGELKAEIGDARIDEAGARRELDRLQAEIDESIRAIEKARVYVPGATIQNRATVRTIPLGPGDLLLVDAADVEIRGGDGPEVKCVLKKTVLGEIRQEQDLTPDFDGIELVFKRSSGREVFGFYKAAADHPALRHEYERFPFKPFLDREFTVVSIKGLTENEGNRSFQIGVTNEQGAGQWRHEWRRHAKLLLTVPKCAGVGVQGAGRGLRVHSLEGPLMVQGGGDRDYQARYEVADLGGSLTACDIPIHRIDGVRGDVSILVSGSRENVSTSFGPEGIIVRTAAPRESSYKDIRGDFRLRRRRVDLTLEGIGGRVDVENDFGKTVWRADRPVAARDHRIVSQSGPIEVHLAPEAPGPLGVALFTECGTIRLPRGNEGLKAPLQHGRLRDASDSWDGLFIGEKENRAGNLPASLIPRLSAAVRGEGRTPGIDIISRAGTITYEPIGAAAGR